MKKGLLQAYDVYCGSFIDVADAHIEATDNPESSFMLKELIEKLSDEAKLMMSAIMNLPDEMYQISTGCIIKQELISWMKRRYHWNDKKIQKHMVELKNAFGANSCL